MKRVMIVLFAVAAMFSALLQESPILDGTGSPKVGRFDAEIRLYDRQNGGSPIWSGRGSSLRIADGYIHNIDDIIPDLDSDEIWVEIEIDGVIATDGRIQYISPRPALRRDGGSGSDILETMDADLNIGAEGHVAHVRSDMGIKTDTPEADLDVNGDIILESGVAVNKILDEDDMASDDVSALATQQSIKAYVDAAGGTDEAIFSVSSEADRSGRFGHMMFVPTEGTEITESDPAHNDTIYIAMGSGASAPCSAPPDPPSTVVGPTTVCEMATGVSYAVPPVAGANFYFWDLPAESYVVSGNGTNSVVVNFGSTDGTIDVYARNDCGTSSSAVSISITMNHPPLMPGSISGTGSVCEGATETYSITPVTGATSYTWSLPSGAFIASGYGTNSISVTVASTSGTVCVTADNSCGSSEPQCMPVTVFGSLSGVVPGAITGSSAVCSGATDVAYSISEMSDATSYSWTVPAEASIVSGSGTNSILVDFGTTSGNVSVTASNSCGSSDARVLAVTVSPNSVGGSISGSSNICLGSDTGTMTLSGNVGAVTKWQKSRDGGGWVDISRTEITYSETPSLAGAWEYRAEVRSGACSAVYSASHTVNVAPTSVGGTVTGGTAVICEGSPTGTMTLSGHTGTVVRWQRSTDGGSSWADISHTAETYSETPPATGSIQYRAIVQSGSCATANSAAQTITVNPATVGGTVTGGTTPICLGENTGTMTLSGHTGTIDRWQRTTNGGSTWTDITHTATTYSETPGSAGTYQYRAAVQSGVCSELFSTASTAITVNSLPSSAFTVSNVNPLISSTVNFSASESGASYSWTFPSGTPSTSTSPTPSVTWSSAGTYTVSYTVTKSGCSDSRDTTITVRAPTTQTFNYTGSAQTWTVPTGVTSITIVAKGGQGGNGDGGAGGLGATMQGDFTVTPGTDLTVVVGRAGTQTHNSGCGGGGSGVMNGTTPLIIAGGGGGAAMNEVGKPGLTTEAGGNSSGNGGTGGNGGGKGYRSGDCGWSGGGGGFTTDGYGGSTGSDGGYPGTRGATGGGKAWLNGGAGAIDGGCSFGSHTYNAFGCGGGGDGEYGGGGGGGYSGGGGGQYVDDSGQKGGGGGGSYNSGSSQVNSSGSNSGNGQVIISY